MDIEDCIKKRKLRKIAPSKEKTNSSLRISESQLEQSKKLFDSDFYSQSIINAYTSMFHCARALLYQDGFQEKSHYAVYIYIKEKYSTKIPNSLINAFYEYQSTRHYILYGLEDNKTTKEEAEDAIEIAEEFLTKIKQII